MKKILTLLSALLLLGSMMVVQAEDYYVAGTMNGWSTSADGYKMELVNGIYKLTKENVYLHANVEFKVVRGDNWNTSWPNSNYNLSNTAGTYTLTITYNPSNNFVNAATGPYYLAGSGLPGISWNSDAIQMNHENRKIFHNISAGSYIIKVTDGSWNWSVGYDERDATNSNVTLVKDGESNLQFTTTGTKDVIIAYNMGTNKITVNAYETAKVKFFAPREQEHTWDHVYVYAWDEGGALTSPWPGDEITSQKEAEWYVYHIRKGGNLLFHDNAGMQTNDITNIQADVCYNSTAVNNNKVTVATDGDCTMSYYIAGYKSLVGGSSDWGTNVQLDENNEIVFQDVPAGEYAFKINNGTWAWSLGGNDHLKAGCASIAQTVGIGNVGFSIDHTQDITVTYYPTTQEICLGAVTTKATGTVSVADMNVYAGKTKTIPVTTNIANYPTPQYEILSGNDYISITDGKISGVAAGTAVVRVTIAETADYLGASAEFNVTVSPLATAKVKFFAPRTEDNPWAQVFAYAWIDDDPQSAPWPGDEITATKNAGWYEYDVPVGANVLFTDHNTAKGVMKTTDILNVTAAKSYVSTSIYYPTDPAEDKIVTITEQNAVTYHVAGSKALIGGEDDFDTNLALDANNQIVFQDVEPGTYSFKINNGTWAWSIGGNDHLKSGDCASIATTVGVGDVGFKIDTKQDITITYYPATQEICLGAETVKATATVTGTDLAIKAGESKKIQYTTNNTETPSVTYTVVSGGEYIGLFKGVITGVKPGEAVVRVSLSETANYTAGSDEFTVTVSNAVAPATAIEAVGGKFIINAKGDTAVFSRGNLTYNVATEQWYCADHQYDMVGEGGNLHFGDANYTGEFDLFGWSCTASNYGLMQSNHDEVYTGDFVEWGNLFTGGEHEWATPSGSQFSYIVNHHQWTTLVLDPTPENADNEDEIYGLALFPIGWVMPAGFEQIHYSLHDWSDDAAFADNTIALSAWSTLEAAGAVFMPMAGARAGHWGNTWSGKAETTTKNSNPNGGQSYCFVDNIGWYGYYWSSTTDPRSEHPYDAQYLIFLGWGEGPTLADDDDVFYPPQVWSREKRRGNTVRLVTISPRQYTVTYTAGEGEGDVPTDAAKYLDGAEITLQAATGLSKYGYRFAGWKFKGQIYNGSYTVNNVLANEEIVFEAQWEEDWTDARTGLTPGNYYTICLPKKVIAFRGASIWNLEKRSTAGTEVYLEEATLDFAAGTPFIIQATADKLEVIYVGAETSTPVENGALRGTLTGLDVDAFAALTGDIYILKDNAIRPRTAGNWLSANRAYIDYDALDPVASAPQPAPGKRVRAIPMQGQTATGMDALNAADTPVKMIINGQLYILRGEQLYDATGRLVK